MQDQSYDGEGYGYDYDIDSTPERSYGDLDPDVPIPSREVSSNFDEHPEAPSEADSVIDAYSFAETTEQYTEEVSELEEDDRETSVIRHDIHQNSPA